METGGAGVGGACSGVEIASATPCPCGCERATSSNVTRRLPVCGSESGVLARCGNTESSNAKCHSGRRTVRPGVEQSSWIGWYIDFASFTLCHILLRRRHLHCVLCQSGGNVTWTLVNSCYIISFNLFILFYFIFFPQISVFIFIFFWFGFFYILFLKGNKNSESRTRFCSRSS